VDDAVEVKDDVAMEVVYSLVCKLAAPFFIFLDVSETILFQLS
jgi:hypothetical protein